MQANHWLPLTEYALRSGMSISTLRRKIKSNAIAHRMEEGRYLIRWDEVEGSAGFESTDAPQLPPRLEESSGALSKPSEAKLLEASTALKDSGGASSEELSALRSLVDRALEENGLRWRALEARVSGIAKKMELYAEHMSELKMLVKLFEEKLDRRA